jgi:probable rRNA maturation factor
MSMVLEWSNEQEEMDISESLVRMLQQLLELAADSEGLTSGEVALTLVDNDAIHDLNRVYRGIDRPTDVLSFAMRELGEEEPLIQQPDQDEMNELLGDIIISIPKAIEQAEEYGHSFERELGFLFVHGFLHLVGYDHQDEEAERIMFSKQEQILQAAGVLR